MLRIKHVLADIAILAMVIIAFPSVSSESDAAEVMTMTTVNENDNGREVSS